MVTRVQRVTTQGRITTVEKQVTVTTPTAPTSAAPLSGASGGALNDAGFRKMQAGDYAAALPLLERAVQRLPGRTPLTRRTPSATSLRPASIAAAVTASSSSSTVQGRSRVSATRSTACANNAERTARPAGHHGRRLRPGGAGLSRRRTDAGPAAKRPARHGREQPPNETTNKSAWALPAHVKREAPKPKPPRKRSFRAERLGWEGHFGSHFVLAAELEAAL